MWAEKRPNVALSRASQIIHFWETRHIFLSTFHGRNPSDHKPLLIRIWSSTMLIWYGQVGARLIPFCTPNATLSFSEKIKILKKVQWPAVKLSEIRYVKGLVKASFSKLLLLQGNDMQNILSVKAASELFNIMLRLVCVNETSQDVNM